MGPEPIHSELKLLSISEAARLLSLGRDTVKHFISSGKIGVIKTGKRLKIPYTELVRFQNIHLQVQSEVPTVSSVTHSSYQIKKSIFSKGSLGNNESFNPRIILSKIMKE